MTSTAAPPGPLSVIDRKERGRQARREVPRRAHGDWAPAKDRPDPVAVVSDQDAARVPELVPIRYGRMLVSPFTFFRGAAAIMAADLAETPTSGISVQLCGDAHVSNFGVFSAPDRRLVFDLNDFDETHPGPWEWDLKRLCASLEIAGRDNGFKPAERRTVVRAAAEEYRTAMRTFADMGNLPVWYARLDVEDAIDRLAPRVKASDVEAARRVTAKARRKDSLRAVAKLTERTQGELRFISDPPVVTRIEDLVDEAEAEVITTSLQALLEEYQHSLRPDVRHLVKTYRAVDIARKVVGVGSVGTRAWVLALQGRDIDDPLVLQAKEAGPSVLEPFTAPSEYANHGERVVRGQRYMQAASDMFLGWQTVKGIDGLERDFYLRQLWDGKASADIATQNPERMAVNGRLCGWTLARAHARSGDRVAIAAYLGGGDRFDRAMADFAEAYADRNDEDFRLLERAVADGRIQAQTGV